MTSPAEKGGARFLGSLHAWARHPWNRGFAVFLAFAFVSGYATWALIGFVVGRVAWWLGPGLCGPTLDEQRAVERSLDDQIRAVDRHIAHLERDLRV